MSNRYYNDLWRDTQSLLEETTYADNIQLSSKPSKDRKTLSKQTGIIFAKYILAINKLGECYDQMVHPQKRLLIRRILDFTVIRCLELKHELVNLTISEFTYLDEAVVELQLIPQEIELKIPECYRYERRADIEWKNNFVEDTLHKMGFREEGIGGIEMTEEEAILLIQRHERARQYRIRAQFMKNIRDRNNRLKEKPGEEPSDVGRASALKIQRVWRGFTTRSKIRKQVVEEMLLIGKSKALDLLK